MIVNRTDILRILPHQAPMVLVSQGEWQDVLHFVGQTHAELVEPFLQSGSLPGWLCIELAAQSSAVHSGTSASQEQKTMKHGYLVGVSQWSHRSMAYAGEVIISHIQVSSTLGPLILVNAQVVLKGETIASGSLKFHVEFA